MVKQSDKLTDIEVKSAKSKDKPYKLADGRGLFVEVSPNGGKYWRLKFRILDKEKLLSIRVYSDVLLKAARKIAYESRDKINQGIDPCEEKRQIKIARAMSDKFSFQSIRTE